MSDSTSWNDRSLSLIDGIVETTLKGQIRSKEQVYQMLVEQIETGSGEIFDRCLADRLATTQQQVDTETDELKQAKATRRLRALKTIRGEWERWQKENLVREAIASSLQQIFAAEPENRLTVLLGAIDPNQKQPLSLKQLQQLAKALKSPQLPETADPDLENDLQQFHSGIALGLACWQRLEPHLVSWMYSRSSLGFGGTGDRPRPWELWAKQANSPFPSAFFNTIALDKSIVEFAATITIEKRDLVELAVVLQCLQRGLVQWFDKLIYDAKVGTKLSISTFLTFAAIWCQLADGFPSNSSFVNPCFQVALQILRAFSRQQYFPLYGGIFASFSGQYLKETLSYLDKPMRLVKGTEEKARILTLLGYSQQTLGSYEGALAFHGEALEIAREMGDRSCEIANLNHLSRTYVAQKDYGEAINYSQRALILSRQAGDRQGEANALANFGYSEVFRARAEETMELEVYESSINYLERGLQLSVKLGDRQSQSLCFSSLGIAYIVLEKPEEALKYLAEAWQAAQYTGDLYLQGVNLAYLARAYYSLQNFSKAISTGSVGMYLLSQIGATEWRETAALLTVLQGQLGEVFQKELQQQRPQILPIIGVDGYDYIPELLIEYRESLH